MELLEFLRTTQDSLVFSGPDDTFLTKLNKKSGVSLDIWPEFNYDTGLPSLKICYLDGKKENVADFLIKPFGIETITLIEHDSYAEAESAFNIHFKSGYFISRSDRPGKYQWGWVVLHGGGCERHLVSMKEVKKFAASLGGL